MKNLRRILAILGIILLVGIYASTLVFALMKNPIADRLLMASIFCTVAVPVLLYAMLLVARHLEQQGEALRQAESQDDAPQDNASQHDASQGNAPQHNASQGDAPQHDASQGDAQDDALQNKT